MCPKSRLDKVLHVLVIRLIAECRSVATPHDHTSTLSPRQPKSTDTSYGSCWWAVQLLYLPTTWLSLYSSLSSTGRFCSESRGWGLKVRRGRVWAGESYFYVERHFLSHSHSPVYIANDKKQNWAWNGVLLCMLDVLWSILLRTNHLILHESSIMLVTDSSASQKELNS